MNDGERETPRAAPVEAAPAAPPAAPSGPAAPLPVAPVVAPTASWRADPWLLIAVFALGLAAWQWFETRLKLSDTQQELARRLAESEALGAESRALAKQAQEQLAGVLGRLGALEGRIADSQSQQALLESLYQDLARSREEWVLAEVEQGVTLAAQQLQLAGNVQGAVLALQTADARLAASSRPQFIALRKVFTRDLERLRALPQVDVAGMNLRLENVINAIDGLPLAVDGRPRVKEEPVTPAAESTDEPASAVSLAFWRRLAGEFWSELRSLVRIQRFDRAEPALLAPGQDFFLRENLKLRLLNARLALLARDQWTFRNELRHAQAWLERYFDPHSAALPTA
ncbi:uroporphyrinogen-III C-methyltransferase, partial [Accumulibacter sp.]